MDSKLKEIMLKNVWEIENNPVFFNSTNGANFMPCATTDDTKMKYVHLQSETGNHMSSIQQRTDRYFVDETTSSNEEEEFYGSNELIED